MKSTIFLVLALTCTQAFAGFQGLNGSSNLGIFNKVKCSTGLTCSKVGDAFSVVSSPTISTGSLTIVGANDGDDAVLFLNADRGDDNADYWKVFAKASDDVLYFQNKTSGSYVSKMSLDASGNAAIAGTLSAGGELTATAGISLSGSKGIYSHGWRPAAFTSGTSVAAQTGTVYLSKIVIPTNAVLTGIKVANALPVGTDKWIAALYDANGNSLANSALAGTLSSGASTYQSLSFTSPYSAVGPAVYWIGIYGNGTTGAFWAIPAVGEIGGYAGSITGKTFGTVGNITVPSSFTADKGPVAFTF